MFSKKRFILTTLAGMAAALLIVTQTAGSKPGQQANKLEGAWIATVPGYPMQWNAVLASNPSGRSAGMYGSLQVRIPADLLDPDVPSTDYSSDYVGEAVMTGPDTAKFTIVGHAINKVTPSEQYPFWEKVEFVWVGNGEFKFNGPGTISCTFTLTDYYAGADGLPDYSRPLGFSTSGGALVTRVGVQ